MIEDPRAARLKAFIRDVRPGGCKMPSLGDGCQCLLCDADSLAADVAALVKAREMHTTAIASFRRWASTDVPTDRAIGFDQCADYLEGFTR